MDDDTTVDSQQVSPPSYFTTFTKFMCTQKAVLLLAEIIFCSVILIYFRDSELQYHSLSGAELSLAVFFFVIYSFGLHTKIQFISWPWCDFFRTLAAAILYLISSIPAIAEKRNRPQITEGALGIFAICLFGYDAFISFPLRR